MFLKLDGWSRRAGPKILFEVDFSRAADAKNWKQDEVHREIQQDEDTYQALYRFKISLTATMSGNYAATMYVNQSDALQLFADAFSGSERAEVLSLLEGKILWKA